MLLATEERRLELPESLRSQLLAFRSRVWAIKIAEATGCAIFGVTTAYLATFVLDRLWDTPASIRFALFLAALAICAIVPLAIYRWVWRHRRLEQLAILLGRKHASIGDQLLGIIELVGDESEQARSLALCEAAIEQVAEQAESKDFSDAIPNPKHMRMAVLAVAALGIGLAIWVLYPAAAANAWARFSMTWRDTPRYTFAMVEELADTLFIAHGEPFSLSLKLSEQTVSRPTQAEVRIGAQPTVVAALANERYEFELPPQIDAGWLAVRVGDFTKRLRLEPILRPELSSIVADVRLPEYLGRADALKRDVRGGTVSLLNGSRATFTATASRELSSAKVDGTPVVAQGTTLSNPATPIQGDRRIEFTWRDRFGLSGKDPFVLTINGREDEPPSIACDGLPQRKVVLDSEQLAFKLTAQDDYGVKRVGMEWRGIDKINFKTPAAGERILAAGGPDKELLEAAGTFSAKAFGIEAQPIEVRLFAEDYFPGRARVYSPAYVLYVLTPEQHAIWLTEQLSKWHRQSLDVRDREMQLFDTNKQLRQLSAEEINRPESRRRIENQADAERANGRRLSSLVTSGEDLIKQAMRNPEFGVGHLEKWAEMLQILKDIAANRMPSVAELLKQASQAPHLAQNTPPNPSPAVGQIRTATPGKAADGAKKDLAKKNVVPGVVDIESSQQPVDPKQKNDEQPPNAKSGSGRLGLPTTMLAGAASKQGDSCPAGEKMDEAVRKQQDLLAEFEMIADELNRVLANLEGSTLVKRLKAASRLQYRVGGRLGDQVSHAFGVQIPPSEKPASKPVAGDPRTERMIKELEHKLAAKITLERGIAQNTTLGDVLRFLGDRYDVTIGIDYEAFGKKGGDVEDHKVALPKMVGVSLEKVLRQLTAQVNATFVVKNDRIEVTTEKAAQAASTRSDVKTPAPNRTSAQAKSAEEQSKRGAAQENLFKELSGQESKSSQDLSNIMDDMQAYFERRRFVQFKTVLDEMVKQDVIGSLRQLSDDLRDENGLSIAQCEYWSDTFDRWAEDLVEPTSGGT
jgi:hypothetical protein